MLDHDCRSLEKLETKQTESTSVTAPYSLRVLFSQELVLSQEPSRCNKSILPKARALIAMQRDLYSCMYQMASSSNSLGAYPLSSMLCSDASGCATRSTQPIGLQCGIFIHITDDSSSALHH
ncbi:unnamed protein product [Prunus armeniaca]|uniref:Uncharacterized protein n=1 Tax=Prunus armeniaca TaxID=36596 RepID=A0A6J5VN22_PRUAR|nr:unnamed protein product [Prunus armeniaca]